MCRETCTPVAVLIDKGHLFDRRIELGLHVFQEGELIAGPPGILGGDAEDGLETLLGDLVGHRYRHDERHAVTLGHRRDRIGHRRIPATGEDVDLFGVDQTFGLLDTFFRLRFGIGIDHFELGAAQGFDTAGGIDLLHRHFPCLFGLQTNRSGRTGKGNDTADLDILGKGRCRTTDKQRESDNRNSNLL